jgi:hypothetical protein
MFALTGIARCPTPPATQGAVAAVPVNATGFVHRGALFSVQYGAEWEREVDTNRAIPLIDQMQAALDPFFEPDGVSRNSEALPRAGAWLQHCNQVECVCGVFLWTPARLSGTQ